VPLTWHFGGFLFHRDPPVEEEAMTEEVVRPGPLRAGRFTLTTVTIARHTRIVSRWLTVTGLASALLLLVAAGTVAWIELLFPAWILALSIDILLSRSRADPQP
jgi:hypothetical protein